MQIVFAIYPKRALMAPTTPDAANAFLTVLQQHQAVVPRPASVHLLLELEHALPLGRDHSFVGDPELRRRYQAIGGQSPLNEIASRFTAN